ncbi:MAG: hypothetical protein GY789_09505 [Hyphomicrobiales bacterium]|nr:hypothetical protein [Hyphomicrobiales bacterium]MCP4998651.1 hypothetical protein [Hyphomicrobiales bacterium]
MTTPRGEILLYLGRGPTCLAMMPPDLRKFDNNAGMGNSQPIPFSNNGDGVALTFDFRGIMFAGVIKAPVKAFENIGLPLISQQRAVFVMGHGFSHGIHVSLDFQILGEGIHATSASGRRSAISLMRATLSRLR